MFKSGYQPLDAELCKTSANAVAQTRSRENPITEPTVSFFSCGFCLSWYCWLLWGSAHRAAQENTLSCRDSAQAGTEIGPAEACLSVCLRGGQQYLWLLWGFTGDEAEWRKRGEKRESFFHDSPARDLLCVSKLSYDVVFTERQRVCSATAPRQLACHSLAELWHQLSPKCWADEEVPGWTSWRVK